MLSRFCVEIAAHSVELTEVECENLHCRLSVGLGLVSVTRSHRDHGSESPVLAKTPAPNLGLRQPANKNAPTNPLLGWAVGSCLANTIRAWHLPKDPSEWKRDSCLNSLAAAHAELGDFTKAIEWQTKAVELIPLAKRPKLELRLELFREGKPYRESHTAN